MCEKIILQSQVVAGMQLAANACAPREEKAWSFRVNKVY
jgi:hypothetical protein